jgi:hypothetical protein
VRIPAFGSRGTRWKTARGSSSTTEAKRLRIPGRSKMWKWDVVEALRKSR